MTVMFYVHTERMQILFLRIWRKWATLSAVLSDVIPGIRVVKAFAQEDHEVTRFKNSSLAVEQEAENLHREWTRFWPQVVMLMHACSLIVWIIGAPRVMQYLVSGGKEGMPLGVFLAFVGYMWMFWEPVQRLGMMSRVINRVTTSASRTPSRPPSARTCRGAGCCGTALQAIRKAGRSTCSSSSPVIGTTWC